MQQKTQAMTAYAEGNAYQGMLITFLLAAAIGVVAKLMGYMPHWVLMFMYVFQMGVVWYYFTVVADTARVYDDGIIDPVDPWVMQRELMIASGQELPTTPMITDGSLMYAALILEEGAETMQALAAAMVDAVDGYQPSMHRADRAIISDLVQAASVMNQRSLHIRSVLADKPNIRIALRDEEAKEIFDGTTDITVVNCGFAEASGLPGAAGYLEIGTSNHSKKNPDTGVIDKTPDGKWIKGRDYRAPDLGRVLQEQRDSYA